ncbi:MAG: response regulator [Myxococcales bacterium]|nr:response regulator [Myxococcales bacterium]
MAKKDPPSILIVDDDRATQRMLADALSKQGFAVAVERDGEWALKTFEKKSFEAVVLDLLLPAINGYEVARKLRATIKGKKTPIVMISGVYKNALHQKEAVQKHGAFAFLEKPVRLQALYETLKSALGDRYPQKREEPPPPPMVDEVTAERFADAAAQEEISHVETQSRRSVATFQSIRGDFTQRPFPEVLAEIYRWKGNGALLLRRDKVKKIAYFRDGVPVSIKSNLLSECLGRVMVREKMISEAECEESLKRMKATSRQQGTVLIEMGCISPHNLVYALTLQLQLKLFDVFAWEKGEYQFNPKVPPPPDPVNLEMTTAAIIHEGVRRCYDAARLSRAMGSVDALFVHPSEHPLLALQDAGLGEEENQLLQAADGHKTVSTLRALAVLSPLETDRFLYAMTCAQMIELRDRPAEGKPKPTISKLADSAPRPPPLPPPPPQLQGEAKGQTAPPLPSPWDAGPTDPSAEAPLPKKKPGKGDRKEPVLARAAGSLLPELSEVVSTGSLSGEESLIRERLVNKVQQMRKLSYFEVLGVAQNASREEVKRAYFALAKEYHPDKHFGSASAEIRQLAGQIYDLISTAHDTLADPDERDRYLKDLASGVKRDIGDEVGKILAAEGKFQKGEELLRQRNFRAACGMFQEAIELYGEEGEFHAYLGWTIFQLNPEDPSSTDSALRSLEKAVSLNPKLDRSYLFTGYLYKATGRPDKAEKQFEKAIQCNPDCTEALRELRILGKAKR